MRYKSLLILFILIILTSTMGYCESELPEYVREQLHNDITYTIITENNLDKLDEILAKGHNKHFLVLQAIPEKFEQQHADKLMNWIEDGGVMWFYDSRLAGYFGMENSPLDKNDIRYKDHRGDLGNQKVPGISIIAYSNPATEHPVHTGVQAIQVFLSQVEDDKYSAVSSKTPGVIPAFVADVNPRAIVALKETGKGWVVFKPLLWPKALGGERFQANLKEFSGGYPVPQLGKNIIPMEAFEGKPVKLPRYDNVILADGQQVMGMVTAEEFEFMGADGTVTQKVEDIASLKFSPSRNMVELKNGTEFDGYLMSMSIKFKTITGKTIELEKENISKITFNIGKDGESNVEK
ncbi:MAG: hypothetical protein ACLFQV_02845 [Vulcanimicrobiota bacterium]